MPAIKVQELVKYHTEIPGSPTLYTATFMLAMNKAKYDALPADLQEVIDANSGQAAAAMAGKIWDEQAPRCSTWSASAATPSARSRRGGRALAQDHPAGDRRLDRRGEGPQPRRREARGGGRALVQKYKVA